MKKCDLRSGMIVVNRSGKKGIVLLGTSREMLLVDSVIRSPEIRRYGIHSTRLMMI
jgi:hypothetical protein